MENATGYEMAKHMLTDTPLLSPTYFILGGNSSRQVFVLCVCVCVCVSDMRSNTFILIFGSI